MGGREEGGREGGRGRGLSCLGILLAERTRRDLLLPTLHYPFPYKVSRTRGKFRTPSPSCLAEKRACIIKLGTQVKKE